MPTEIERHALYQKIEEEWGEGHADVLMSHLPPVGWADVATKQDLAHLGTELRLEMAKLGSDLRKEIAGVRTEVSDKIAGVRTEIAGVRTEVSDKIAGVRTEIAGVRTEVSDKIAGLQRTMISLMVLLTAIFGAITTIAAIAS